MQLLAQLAQTLGVSRGQRIGKYRVVRRLAEGGMGEIFVARAEGREGFAKVVVLKRILQQNLADPLAVRMFLDEARLMAALNHPNIVQVYDFGTAAGGHFFAMEYVHGEDLGRIMKAATLHGRTLSLPLALGTIAEAAAGLHYAHEKRGADGLPLQIVHRDISPSNVLVSYDGAVKLTDFGIARWNTRRAETRYGAIKGKIAYMSPEQCRAGPLDRRSDVFGLGILLYELTTGTRLYQGASDFAVLEQIVHHDVPRPSTRRPDYPLGVERIVMRALARDPEQRHQSARELQLDLEAYALEARLPISAVARAEEMRALFGDAVEAWREAHEAGRSLAAHLAGAAPRPTSEKPERTVTRPEAGAAGADPLPQIEPVGAGARGPRSRRWVPAAVLGGLLAIGAAATPWLRPPSSSPRPRLSPAPAAALAPMRPASPPETPVVSSSVRATASSAAPPASASSALAPIPPKPASSRTARAQTASTRLARRHPAAVTPSPPAEAPPAEAAKKIWNPDSIYLP